ncbi:hypothetical protein VBD025_15290 [Virgibacillus flavescens]|uniref:hypothetical protein n=1 Tax=Virgibacillus flavescens TaxID=1611422 RepID=UPI003D3254B4
MKKKAIVITISCLVLIAGSFIVVNHFSNLKEETTIQNIDSFTDQIIKSLHKEGYTLNMQTADNIRNNTITVTIGIPKNEHEGKQTNDHIRSIIEHLAKRNELDSFSVKINIEKIS